jgi:hypothetical protein
LWPILEKAAEKNKIAYQKKYNIAERGESENA